MLAKTYGWQTVYGFAGLMMLLPFFVMLFLAKEPPDREEGHGFLDQIKCLVQPDGWMFNSIYIITFGGFLGLATYLPTFFHDQFGIDPAEAKYYTTFAVLMGSGVRVVGGYLADKIGGIVAVSVVLMGITGTFLATSVAPSLGITVVLLICCFAALGLGNGALFQLVPLRWPATAAVAGSMIGEIGALGGAILPNALAYSKQHYRQLRRWVHRVRGSLGGDPRGAAHRAALLGRQMDRSRRTRAFRHAGHAARRTVLGGQLPDLI